MNIEEIWNDYGNLLRGFLRSRVKNSDDVEDLLQEILIKTHKNMGSLKDPKKLKSWLFQIARNTLIDYYRKPHNTLSVESQLSELQEESSDAQEIMSQELSQCIKPFIKNLPTKYGDVVNAIDLQGASQKELAKELGLSYSAVKSRAQRGRQKLKELFQKCCTYKMDVRGNIMEYEAKSDSCEC
jgi:RNA polymerase sigma-70 factor (ECF subfamily)